MWSKFGGYILMVVLYAYIGYNDIDNVLKVITGEKKSKRMEEKSIILQSMHVWDPYLLYWAYIQTNF